MDTNRFKKISEFHKSASKVGRKGASGINFSYAESALAKENPGVSFSKEQVLERILEDPVFSNEDLDSIFEINIENHHAKMMNKKEKAFIEIGAFLTQKQDRIQEIGDYLMSESAKPGWIEERYGDSFFSKESITEAFGQLDQAQRDFHEEAARRDAEERTAAGRFGNGYETNEVIKEFEDGWKVVYVPAVDEGPNYRGDELKSNDRTVEGNILGLCLGSTAGYYQTNDQGKIYSVRDPGNNPRVTIRIHDNILQEAKGKNNLPPDVEAAKKAAKWFESQDELQYEDCYDFRKFPPLDAEDAKNKFERNPDEAYSKGWIVNWYRSGVDSIDKSVEERIASRDISIIYAGFGKKYKQLVQPVAEYWAKQWTENRHAHIWGEFEKPEFGEEYSDKLSHESWKTYRKEPWMIKAAERLMNSRYAHWAFEVIRIHTIPEYTDLARKKVEDIVSEIDEEHRYGVPGVGQRVSEFSFLEKYKFHETYPDLSFPLAKRMARSHPERFFANKLQNTYPDLGLSLAKEFAEKKPTALFDDDFNIFESYPDLAEATVKRLAEENPSLFFIIMTSMDHEPPLLDKYPDIALPAAKRLAEENPFLFFKRYLNSYYRDLGIIAAKNALEKNPDKFLDDGIYTIYPDIGLPAAKHRAETNFNSFIDRDGRYSLRTYYPDITLSIAKDLVASANPNESSEEQAAKGPITFFEKGLHNMFPELSYTAAESIARFAPNIFFKKRFPKLFPPPLESTHPLASKYPDLQILAEISMGGAVPDELPDEEIGRGKEIPFGNMDEVNPYFSTYEKEEEESENFYNDPDLNEEGPSDLDFVDPKDSPPPTYVLPENAVSKVEVTKRRSKLSSLQSYLNKSGLEKEADEVGMMIESFVKESGLDRWFKEKWVDISKKDKSGKHPPCGREDADKGKYPKCRPSKRVSSKTPKTTKELSSKDKKKAVKDKRKAEKKKSKPAGGGSRKPKRAPSLKRKKSSAEIYLTKLSCWLQKNGFEEEYNQFVRLSKYNTDGKKEMTWQG